MSCYIGSVSVDFTCGCQHTDPPAHVILAHCYKLGEAGSVTDSKYALLSKGIVPLVSKKVAYPQSRLSIHS